MGDPNANWLVGRKCFVRYIYDTFLTVHACTAFLPFDCYTLELLNRFLRARQGSELCCNEETCAHSLAHCCSVPADLISSCPNTSRLPHV